MVFIGGWRSRRRGYGGGYGRGYRGGYDDGYGYGPGYRRGFGGGNSCARDLFLVEGGCCLAELIGCGPQLLLISPTLVSSASRSVVADRPGAGTRVGAHRFEDRVLSAMIAAIRRYQREISPRRPASCRYTPTCSHYGLAALQQHGLRRGTSLTLRRLVRCRPGALGGHDPVPPAR